MNSEKLYNLMPVLSLALGGVFFLSPFYFFLIAIFFMNFYDFNKNQIIRIYLSILSILSIIYMYGSIDFGKSEIPDYLIYYQAAKILKYESLLNITDWPFYPEIGWGAVFWLLQKSGYNIQNINDVAIINLVICLFGFYFWFEKYGKKGVDSKYYGLLTATTLLFISVITLTFLQRQSLSVIFLLFAISNYKNSKFYLFVILASLFHLSSLPIALIYKFLLSRKFKLSFFIFIFIFIILLRVFFIEIVSSLSFLMQGKGDFYVGNEGFSIVSFRLAIYSLLMFAMVLFFANKINHDFKNIIIFSSLLSFGLIGINLASERLNFITLYLYGYFVFLLLYKRNIFLLIFLNLIFLLILFYEKSGVFFNPVGMWEKYPFINSFSGLF